MNSSRHFAVTWFGLAWMIVGIGVQVAWAEPASSDRSSGLTTARSQRLDEAVERALQWLAGQQQRDGSFPAMPNGQPGVTSLAALAFLSAGHLPESEPYGSHLHRAIDYVLSCEREAGLLNAAKPGQRWEFDAPSHTGYYNHAIAGLMLSESSGQLQGQRSEKVVAAIERALGFTTKKQLLEIAGRPQDEGGWRYPVPHPTDSFKSDLSITAWQLTFLRSAANAGFDVKSGTIDAAEKYVKGLYKEKKKNFTYDHRRVTRGVTGAGIMAMAMLGQHGSKEALAAANWIKRHPFKSYGERVGQLDRFHYSVYYCTQGMYQIGGKDFREFFPHVVDLLVQNQRPDGSWPAVDYERRFGDAYVTAMSVLALTTHYGLLPIHQR